MEPDMPMTSSPKQYQTEPIVLSTVNSYPLQGATSIKPYLDLLNSSEADHLYALSSYKALKRYRPSPVIWRLILLIGDSAILLPFLVWLTKPALYGTLSFAPGVFGASAANALWVFLAYASWTFAVNVTQAQDLSRAASRLKSPLYALCSLVFVVLFLGLFFYLRAGNQIISYVEPLLSFLAIVAFALSLWRVFMAEIMNMPSLRRRAVIVGVNAAGRELAGEFLKIRHRSVDIIGYIVEPSDGRKEYLTGTQHNAR